MGTRCHGSASSRSSKRPSGDSLVLGAHHTLVEAVSNGNESLRAEDRLVGSMRAMLASLALGTLG